MATIISITAIAQPAPEGTDPADVDTRVVGVVSSAAGESVLETEDVVVEGSVVVVELAAGIRLGVTTTESPDELAALSASALKTLLRPLVDAARPHPHIGAGAD